MNNPLFASIDLFMIASLLVIAVSNLLWFFYRREEKHFFFFGMLCLIFAFRVAVTGSVLAFQVFPGMPEGARVLLEYFTFYLAVPVFFAYIVFLFMDRFNLSYLLPVSIVAVIFILLTGFLPPGLQKVLVYIYGVFMVIIGVYCLIGLFKKMQQKDVTALYIFIGLAVLLCTGMWDILAATGVIEAPKVTNYWIVLFSYMQALRITIDSANAYTLLEKIYEKTRELDKSKDDFLLNISLELQEPLQGMVGLSESLLKRDVPEFTSDQKASLAMIISSGRQLSNIVSGISDFARIKEKDLVLNKRPIDFPQIVKLVLLYTKTFIQGKDISIENQVSEDLPPVLGDENRIENVLYTLIGNAIRYTQAGTILVSARHIGGFIEVTVVDPSSGTFFEDYREVMSYPVDDLTYLKGYTGPGLGVAIIRYLILLHGGVLTLEKREKDALAFIFTLPAVREKKETTYHISEDLSIQLDALEHLEALEEEAGQEAPEGELLELPETAAGETAEEEDKGVPKKCPGERGQTEDVDGRSRVLTVDDDPVYLQMIKNSLSSIRCSMVPAMNGKEALRRIEEKKPDIVLLDIMMPGMSGYQICRKIRETYSPSELPIILITQGAEVSTIVEGFAAGANDFLSKPFTQDEFSARLKTHLSMSRISKVYSRFVPTELIRYLGHNNIVDVNVGDQIQREMTVLFVDIRAFTSLSEKMTPQENFKFINSYLSRISPIISRHNGFVDKYIGDSIMALYPDRPEDAIKTAVEMIEHLHVYNSHRANCNYDPIDIGIGIHTGMLIMGIIGDGERMQGTVISDSVNLASRIQDLTKLYGANIVISQETFIQMENPTLYNFRFLGKVKVKGKEKSVSVFEIFDADPEDLRNAKAETKTDFEEGILLFAKRSFTEAARIFENLVQKNPNDRATLLFLDRTKKFLAQKQQRPQKHPQ